MSPNEKTYRIKIPVYSSELIEEKDELFEGYTYDGMIKYLDEKYGQYKKYRPKISRSRRNKIKEVEIQDIQSTEHTIGKIPIRLYKITAYNTNLIDGFVETEQKFNLNKKDKIGSENNFMLLYPQIFGLDKNKYCCQWKILFYEDPSKENREIVSICKTVLKQVFKINVKNIKLDRVLQLLKKKNIISELSLQFYSQSYDDNEVDTSLKNYLVKTSLKKVRKENFKNVPSSKIKKLISDTFYENEFQKRVIKLLFNKKEIKLTKEFIEASNTIKETAEEVFNSERIVSEGEIDNLFNPEYILSIFSEILHEYLSENDE